MYLLTHDDFDLPGLCASQRAKLRKLIGDGPFDPRVAARAYIEAGEPWTDIFIAYSVLVRAGKLPGVGLVWRFAEVAFREQPEANAALRHWGAPGALGPATWRAAKAAADAATATAAAIYAAAAVYAAAAADYVAADADGAADDYANYADADHIVAYAAAYAAAAADYAADARQRVRDEIIEMVLAEVERALAERSTS